MQSRTCGSAFVAAITLLLSGVSLSAQMAHKPTAPDAHQHIYAIVPMIGAGTIADPKRPMFAPAQGIRPALPVVGAAHPVSQTVARSGIIAYKAQISDDGKSAIVEFIAASPDDLKEILTTFDSRVQVFQRGIHTKDQIEAAFKTQKKDFSFDKFRTMGVR